MTSTSRPARSRPALLGSVGAEAVKLWSLRSNRILLAAAVLLIAGSGALFSLSLRARLDDPRFAGQTIEAVPMQFVDSVLWAQILVAVVGVLAVTNEYASGQARLSLLALPTRLPWLLGKTVVLAAAGALVGVLGTAASLGIAAALLPGSGVVYEPELPEAIGLCLRSGLYLAAIAALVVALGALLRHTVAGLVGTLGLLIVAPPVVSSIPGIGWIADYTPTSAGRRIISDFETIAQLPPWVGFGVLAGWVVCGLVLAGVLLKTRDA